MTRDIEFKNDEEFRYYIISNNYMVLLGSQYVFGCEDYEKYREHSDFLGNQKCVFVPSSQIGIASAKDALCVKLDDIIVDIHSPNLDEIGIEDGMDGRMVKYSPTSGIEIDFEKEELKKFIHDERKAVDVYFSVSVGVRKNKKNLCTVIKRK